MTSPLKSALMAGLLSLPLASGCTPVQPPGTHVYTSTTPPIPAQDARIRYVYCVTAPLGYVVPQDKWDPYLVPCPVRPARATKPSDRTDPVDPDHPTPPPPPPPPPPPREPVNERSTAGDASASVTRNGDGTVTETSTAGGATATVTY